MIGGVLQNHLIAGRESWLHGAILSVRWMRSQIGDFEVPEELDDLHDLETWSLFAPFAKKLSKALRKVREAHMLKVQNLCELYKHEKRQSEILQSMGWTKRGGGDDRNPHEHDMSFCDECTEVFPSEASLAVHQQRKHGKRIAMRRYAADSACRACQRFFHTTRDCCAICIWEQLIVGSGIVGDTSRGPVSKHKSWTCMTKRKAW